MIVALILLFVAMLVGAGAFFGKKIVDNYKAMQQAARGTDTKNFKKGIVTNSVIGGACCLVILFGLLIGPAGMYTVHTGEVKVIKTFGKVTGVQEAGLAWRNIFTQSIESYDLKVQQMKISTEVYTNDSQPADVQFAIQYRLVPGEVRAIAGEFGSMTLLSSKIEAVVIRELKNEFAKLTAERIIETRTKLSQDVSSAIETIAGPYYVIIETVAITDIAFSEAFEQAVESKMQAEIEAKKAEAEATRLLIEAEARLKAAEFEKQIAVVQAQADAEAMSILMRLWSGEVWNPTAIKTPAIDCTEVDCPEHGTGDDTGECNEVPAELGDWEKITSAGELTAIRELMLRQMAIEKWDGKLPDTVVGLEFFEMLFGSFGNP